MEAWFRDRYAASGKTLNMGKSCVRYRRFDEIPLDVIGETIARADIDSSPPCSPQRAARRARRGATSA